MRGCGGRPAQASLHRRAGRDGRSKVVDVEWKRRMDQLVVKRTIESVYFDSGVVCGSVGCGCACGSGA